MSDQSTALTVATAPLPATAIDKYSDYASTGGPGWFGELLKFSGKTGIWSAGSQGLEIAKGTKLVAILPAMQVGFVKWKGGELVDQVFKPAAEVGADLRGLRAELDDTDRSLWPADEDGRPADPWKEAAMLPMLSQETGAKFTFSTSSVGGTAACKRLTAAYVQQLRAAPETTSGCLPVVELRSTSYQHTIKQRGTIFNPVLEGVDWISAADVVTISGAAPQPEVTMFEDHRSEKSKKRSNKRI
jgi:hypothetical protein